MKFDEASEVLANFQNNKLVKEGQLAYGLYRAYDVVGMLQNLKQEYAPTIEMTKEEKQNLLDLKSRATFYFFNQSVKRWQQDRIGLQMPYGNLTEDKLMSAWLHPESIVEVE